jgi:hypothetical protein
VQKEAREYQTLREQLETSFQREVTGANPEDDANVDSAFNMVLQTVVALYISTKATPVDVAALKEALTNDTRSLVNSQKRLSSLTRSVRGDSCKGNARVEGEWMFHSLCCTLDS